MKFNSDSEYIQTVLKEESWHKSFYWATGKKPKDAEFYVQEDRVYSNFTNSKGRAMRFYFYFCSPINFSPYLVCGTEFV